MNSIIDLTNAYFEPVPFAHFHAENVLDGQVAKAALDWFEADAPWELSIADFYEQHEFSLLNANPPTTVVGLRDAHLLADLRATVGRLLGAVLSERVDVTIHKLANGQRIRIHNDFIPGCETHRLLIQLNRGWREDNGGMLMLFAGPAPELVTKVVTPVHCSALGFAISPNSHHAVSAVHSGERYTLVYSFYAHYDSE